MFGLFQLFALNKLAYVFYRVAQARRFCREGVVARRIEQAELVGARAFPAPC